MRILMFGWEFPPYTSGGLAVASYNLALALTQKNTEVIFVQPQAVDSGRMKLAEGLDLRSASGITLEYDHFKLLEHNSIEEFWEKNIKVRPVGSLLTPYITPESYQEQLAELRYRQAFWQSGEEVRESTVLDFKGGYGAGLMDEVYRYSHAASAITQEEEFDVIHAHDWLAYPAGIVAKNISGKQLVVHAHALEYDRSGVNVNREIFNIEMKGFQEADKIVAVSHYTKGIIMRQYGIAADKIEVVHNAVTRNEAKKEYRIPDMYKHEKRVLFMGRVTFQKGPEYFVEAARLVLDKIPNARFIMAGSGDMLNKMVKKVAALRMGNRFHFTGFLKGEDIDHMYALSDVYVMSSVSEPFGIAPLEAMVSDVPVIISKQSGVSEVLQNALKVDFWDVKDLADKISAVLTNKALSDSLVKNCQEDLKKIKWEYAADKLNGVYKELV